MAYEVRIPEEIHKECLEKLEEFVKFINQGDYLITKLKWEVELEHEPFGSRNQLLNILIPEPTGIEQLYITMEKVKDESETDTPIT